MVDVLERGGAGLNLTAEVRDGILNHTGTGTPASLEGRIVRLVDRFAYVNHDIDDAARAGILDPADLPAEPVALLGAHLVGAHRRARARPGRDLGRGRATSCSRRRYDDALLELRSFMFEHVYLGPPARAESARAAAMVEALFAHHLAGRRRAVGHRLGRRHDRRLRPARARRAARRPSAPRREPHQRAVARGGQGGRRHGRPGRRPHAAAQGRQPATRAAARSTTSAARRSRSTPSTSSTTASAAAAAATRSGSRRRPRTSTSSARSSGWPTATASSSPTRRPHPRPSAAATSSGACWRCSRTPPASTPATCGSRPRPSPRGPTWPSAACRIRRCATSGSGSRRPPGTGCARPPARRGSRRPSSSGRASRAAAGAAPSTASGGG